MVRCGSKAGAAYRLRRVLQEWGEPNGAAEQRGSHGAQRDEAGGDDRLSVRRAGWKTAALDQERLRKGMPGCRA